MPDTPEKEHQAQQVLTRLYAAARRYSEQAETDIQVGALITEFREALGLKPTAFARHLSVAPQTVGRWERNESRPRLSQLHKFANLLLEESPPSPPEPSTAAPARENLGIRLAGSMRYIPRQVKAVWIFKAGSVSQRERELLDELVVGVLRSGGDMHYVFFASLGAIQSFRRRCQEWRETVPPLGTVTGYGIKDFRLAYTLGLSSAPSTWMVIEYQPKHAARLKRRFDVFLMLTVGEYVDAAQTTLKSEDGQPCWIELATPQASAWIKKLSRLKSKSKGNKGNAAMEMISVGSR